MSRAIVSAVLIIALLAVPAAFAKGLGAAEIISDGLVASGHKDVKALMRAANTLDRMGAHPVEGTNDLVAAWRTEVVRLGARAEQTPYRGRTLGPAYRQYEIASGENLTTRQSFYAGQKAEISLVSVTGARVELKIRDEDGVVVCSLIIANRNGACAWTPGWTASYAIDIVNPTSRAAPIYLITN